MIGVIGTSANPLDVTGVWSHRDRLGVSPTPTSAGVASQQERHPFRVEALRASLDHSPASCLLGSSVGVVPGSYLDLTGHGVLSEPIVTSLSSSCLLFSSIPSSYVHSPEPFGHTAIASDQAADDLRGICKLLEGAFGCHKLVYQPLIVFESHTERLTSRGARSSG